jgi:hypothetical protein
LRISSLPTGPSSTPVTMRRSSAWTPIAIRQR